jgi:hypothetical protein
LNKLWVAVVGANPTGEGFGHETAERLRGLAMSHSPAIVSDMDLGEIVRLLADTDSGRATGPIRLGGYAVVAYDGEADPVAEDDEDYDDDLDYLVVWGTTDTAAEAFDLLGDTLADRFPGGVEDQVEHILLERGVEVNDFD